MSKWIRTRLQAARNRAEAGQTSFEYLGIAVVIAVIISVLAGTTDIGDAVMTGILNKITAIAGNG